MEITSLSNDLVKQTAKLQQKKHRTETGLFLIEGFKALEEAILSGIQIEKVFVNKNVKIDKIVESNKENNFELIYTNEEILKKISTTDSAPEIVAIAKQKKWSIKDLKNAQKIVLLENIKDYGNLGTILRTAKAFKQDAIILYGDTVDLYNPKCVRASVGNLWKMPVVQIKTIDVLNKHFNDFQRVATLPKAVETIFLKDFEAKSPYIIMFGSEADGLSSELSDFADKKVTIEMSNSVESLNLAISVGVFLYKTM